MTQSSATSLITYLKSPAFLAFIGAIIVYGAFSSPTPDHPHWPEFTVIGLFICFVLLSGISFKSMNFYQKRIDVIGSIFFVYVLTVPVIIAASSGHSESDIFRDVISILALGLPIILTKTVLSSQSGQKLLIGAVVWIGLCFVIRDLIFSSTELLYLTNSSTVLFASIFLFGAAISKLSRSKGFLIGHWGIAIFYFIIVAICIFAVSLNLQRATTGVFILSSVIILASTLKYSTISLSVFLFMLLGVVWFIPSLVDFSVLGIEILEKNRLVGLNMRLEETKTVIEALSINPINMFFGLGWGASFSSPAVADIWVSFTHNFFTSILLKTGFVGLVLVIFFIMPFVKNLIVISRYNLVLGLALTGPFLIGIMLYANYKSLGFGLILSIIALSHHETTKTHSIH